MLFRSAIGRSSVVVRLNSRRWRRSSKGSARCSVARLSRGAEDHRGDPAAGSDRQDPHPPGAGSPAAAPGTGERGGPRVRRRLRSARHPGRAPWAGAQALQPGCAPSQASGPSTGSRPGSRPAAARRAAAFTPGCVRIGAFASCSPLPMALAAPAASLGRAFEIPIRPDPGRRPCCRRPSTACTAWSTG